eukprot:9354313-Pyramimonas_sp.AAC.1
MGRLAGAIHLPCVHEDATQFKREHETCWFALNARPESARGFGAPPTSSARPNKFSRSRLSVTANRIDSSRKHVKLVDGK